MSSPVPTTSVTRRGRQQSKGPRRPSNKSPFTVRAARCEQLEETLEAQAVSLTQKEALIEGQGCALLSAEATLVAAKAKIDRGRKHVMGKCQD